MAIMAVDPGKNKCGIAVLEDQKNVLMQKIILTETIFDAISNIMIEYNIEKVVVGNGTTAKRFCSELLEKVLREQKEKLVCVEEAFTTVEAKKLYWQKNPPQSWQRWLPLSWLRLPCAVDDYAAIILAKRYLEGI